MFKAGANLRHVVPAETMISPFSYASFNTKSEVVPARSQPIHKPEDLMSVNKFLSYKFVRYLINILSFLLTSFKKLLSETISITLFATAHARGFPPTVEP